MKDFRVWKTWMYWNVGFQRLMDGNYLIHRCQDLSRPKYELRSLFCCRLNQGALIQRHEFQKQQNNALPYQALVNGLVSCIVPPAAGCHWHWSMTQTKRLVRWRVSKSDKREKCHQESNATGWYPAEQRAAHGSGSRRIANLPLRERAAPRECDSWSLR